MALPKECERYSWNEYRSWPEGERWELIEGVAWDMSPSPSRNHQQILVDIVSQFYLVLKYVKSISILRSGGIIKDTNNRFVHLMEIYLDRR